TSVKENQPEGTLVGILQAQDKNDGETFTYSIVGFSSFKLSGNQLLTDSIFDYERSRSQFYVKIRVTDYGGLSYEKTLTITIDDIDDANANLSTLGLEGVNLQKEFDPTVTTYNTEDVPYKKSLVTICPETE